MCITTLTFSQWTLLNPQKLHVFNIHTVKPLSSEELSIAQTPSSVHNTPPFITLDTRQQSALPQPLLYHTEFITLIISSCQTPTSAFLQLKKLASAYVHPQGGWVREVVASGGGGGWADKLAAVCLLHGRRMIYSCEFSPRLHAQHQSFSISAHLQYVAAAHCSSVR